MNQPSQPDSPAHWSPGPWTVRVSQAVMWVIVIFGMIRAMRHLAPLFRGTDYGFVAALGLLLVLVAVAVVLHELGHYVAARVQGAHVIRVILGPVEGIPQRGRWRWRWVTEAAWLGGAVVAMPQLNQPFRRHMIWYIAAGSLASLAWALAAAGTAWWVGDGVLHGLLMAFAAISTVIGLTNLLPFTVGSDGVQLIRYWKGLDLGQPGMEVFEVNMRSMAGQTADEMPEQLLSGVERESPPVGLWFRVFAALNRQDWSGAGEVGARLDAWEAHLDRPSRTSLETFIGLLRSELAFARGMVERVAPADIASPLRREMHRLRPGTAERHDALVHALAGRAAECEAALVRAEAESGFNPDAAARKTELRLRAAVRDLLQDARQSFRTNRQPERGNLE